MLSKLLNKQLILNRIKNPNQINKRSSHGDDVFGYREPVLPKTYRASHNLATVLGAFWWWWIMTRAFYDFHHLLPTGPWPQAHTWTDEELGVPPDDDGLAPLIPWEPRSSHPHGKWDSPRPYNMPPYVLKQKYGGHTGPFEL